ncbi:MAG TPA: PEP-CTERM sorting domain-containing protein [Opitutaceae bacterium]|nr:PEP-CTERM sorting domain-containing protein [Opitutaceae bacterium]
MKKLLSILALSALFAASSARATLIDLTEFDQTIDTGGAITFNAGTAFLSGTATLTGEASDLTSFVWRFSTTDYMPYNDYAWVSLAGTPYTLSSVAALGNTEGDSSTTRWQTYTFDTPFTGTIQFGVANGVDDNVPSTLAVSNSISGAVPEPSTYGLLGGLVLLGLVLRRCRKA